jgi:predicted nucleic acid-binding protein
MARQTLVLDASVGVKWFVAAGEDYVAQARAIMKAHVNDEISIIVPELFFHEISNALVNKKTIPVNLIEESAAILFDLGLHVLTINEERLRTAIQIARKAGVTEYNASYAAAAMENGCPLVTANPRHHKPELGCQIIPIDQWKQEGTGNDRTFYQQS